MEDDGLGRVGAGEGKNSGAYGRSDRRSRGHGVQIDTNLPGAYETRCRSSRRGWRGVRAGRGVCRRQSSHSAHQLDEQAEEEEEEEEPVGELAALC